MRLHGTVLVRPRTASRLRRIVLEPDLRAFDAKDLPLLRKQGWILQKRAYFDPKCPHAKAFWLD